MGANSRLGAYSNKYGIQANNMSYGASGNARNVMVELIGRSLGFSDCGGHDDDTR